MRLNDQDSICLSDYSELLDLKRSEYYTIMPTPKQGTRKCPYITCCELQSDDDIIAPPTGEASSTNQHTVGFNDEAVGESSGFDADATAPVDMTPNVDLGKFLSHPVRIAGFSWNQSDAAGTTVSIKPWHLYFNNAVISRKLANYAFLQCDLNIKIVINASPFFYGRMYACYLPLQGITPSTIQIPSGSGLKWLIPVSQRPNLELNPTTSSGGTMKLPFFYHKNWLDVSQAQDFLDMGQLDFIVFNQLKNVNGTTGSAVSVQVFAWADNVKISGPTVSTPLQSGDEYGNGVVSGPASTVARAASWFEDIPIIGPFATATRIGASAVSAIASIFGWTNVPVIADTSSVRNSAFPQLASTSIGFPAEKLTVDPKNELTVDPRILGLTGKDELAIANIVTKESLLCQTTWATTNSVDDLLFTCRVSPLLQDVFTTANGDKAIYMTPLAFLTPLFKHWRGDIVFRFQFICTALHKGRVRISFDPRGTSSTNLINTTDTYSSIKTQIVDIGETQNLEMRIPYQQATAFQQVENNYTAVNWDTTTTPTFNYNPVFDNGVLTVRTQTLLTGSQGPTDMQINIWVRGEKNLEFANPNNINPTISTFAPQSGEETDSPNLTHETFGSPGDNINPERNLVHFGEVTPTLRSILRRFTLSNVLQPVTGTGTEVHYVMRNRISRFPIPYGWDPNGIHTANKQLTTGTGNFNFTFVHPLNYIMPAYVAVRGSTQLCVNTDAKDAVRHIRIYRQPNASGNTQTTIFSFGATTSTSSAARFYMNNLDNGSAGMALTNQLTNAGLVVQLPNYTRYKFQSTNPAAMTTNPTNTGADVDAHCIETSYTPSVISGQTDSNSFIYSKQWRYFAIGTDFNLHWFLNVPTYWSYSAIPTAA